MRTFKIIILGLFVTFGAASTTLAIERSSDNAADTSITLAQAEPDSLKKVQMDMPARPGPFGKRGEFGQGPRQFERLRMRKLIQLLNLEGEQREAFLAIAEKYRDKRRDHMRAHLKTVDSLANGLRQGDLDAEGIERYVKRLDELEAGQAKMKTDFRNEVRPLLNADQYGKLVVFEYRFEAQILDRLNEFRKRHGGPPEGMPPEPPEDMDSFLDEDSI